MRCDESPFTCQCKKDDKKAQRFPMSHFYWSFSSNIMAVKGLNMHTNICRLYIYNFYTLIHSFIHTRPVREAHLNQIQTALHGRNAEWSCTIVSVSVGISSPLQQQLCTFVVHVLDGNVEGSLSFHIWYIDAASMIQQQWDTLPMSTWEQIFKRCKYIKY